MVRKPQNNRIQVPLTPEMRKAYQALADAQRTSLAAVCAEVLEQAAPMVVQIANALETAKTVPSRALRDMAGSLERLTGEANQLQIDLEDKVSPKATRRKYTKKAG
jgi:hypothetical protein